MTIISIIFKFIYKIIYIFLKIKKYIIFKTYTVPLEKKFIFLNKILYILDFIKYHKILLATILKTVFKCNFIKK